MLHPQTTINCRGQLLDTSQPVVMGILNLTPDSFYDGGRYGDERTILEQVERMVTEGATIVDVGGMSSRPGAAILSAAEEWQRVEQPLRRIHRAFPDLILSIDTVRAEVAERAVGAGASIVNDISAGSLDAELWPTVARLQVPYVLMHMQGRPETMQDRPAYENIALEVLDFLIEKTGQLRELGVKDVILDPGFGFGKTLAHNYQLLNHFHTFQILDAPLLAGLSRKSMIYKYLDISPESALNGTTALHMVALQQGAKILRAHDVREAVETVRLFQQLEAHRPA